MLDNGGLIWFVSKIEEWSQLGMHGSFPELIRVPPFPPDRMQKWWLQDSSTSIFHRKKTSYPEIHFCFSSVQLLSRVWLFATPWTVARQASLSIANSRVYSNSCPLSGDAIQPSHLLSSLSPPAFNLSQHQGLFKWISSSHQVAKVLEFQLQHQSFQWIFRTDFLYDRLVGSPCSPRDSQKSSPTPQFKASILWCSAFFTV